MKMATRLSRLSRIFSAYGLRVGLNAVAQTIHMKIRLWCTVGHLNNYRMWLNAYDILTPKRRAAIIEKILRMERRPLFSILMPTYNSNPTYLRAAIDSVVGQLYPHWELCIADDASTDDVTRDILQSYVESDPRIKVVFRPENGHICAASNSALTLATGSWIVLLDHDDLLAEDALFCAAECALAHPNAKLIYSDEDKIDKNGLRSDPYFKPDWNVDLFRSQNMFSHLGILSTELVRSVGGFRLGLEGSQDWDLVLRCIEKIELTQILHVPKVLYHWRVHQESTSFSMEAKPYAIIAGEKALNDHYRRTGVDATVEYQGTGYRTHYTLPSVRPLVSIIIQTRNAAKLLRQCITSVQEKTEYLNYEIIVVNNGSDEPVAPAYLEPLEKSQKIRVVRVMRDEGNHSALNNAAVDIAQGEFIAFLDSDTEVISVEWLSEMVSIATQPGVGAVGARLWHPNFTLQHGGVILGPGALAVHAHDGLPLGWNGYMGRAALTQSFSAVTAACMVVRKSLFKQVGGLDEVNLKAAFNDINLCLRLREAGFRNVWTPYAELLHHESATQGRDIELKERVRFNQENAYMRGRWASLIKHDPAYSPNLTLVRGDFSFAWPSRANSI